MITVKISVKLWWYVHVTYSPTYLVKVTTAELTQQKVLFDCFIDALSKRVKDIDKESKAISVVYNEFSRKLCNTRLNEFVVVHKQLAAVKEGKASREKLKRYLIDTACTVEV